MEGTMSQRKRLPLRWFIRVAWEEAVVLEPATAARGASQCRQHRMGEGSP